MYCQYCGKKLLGDSQFCQNCGKRQNKWLSCKSHVLNSISTNKVLLYIYLVWVFIHFSLCFYFSPTPQDAYSPHTGFYPFDESLGDILNGEWYYLSLIDNIDVYDNSELFCYTTIFPFIIFVLVKCSILIITFLIRLTKRWQKQKGNEYQENTDEYEDASPKQEYCKISNEILGTADNIELGNKGEETIETENRYTSSRNIIIESQQNIVDDDINTMPLIRRFFGSIIDKVFVVMILFGGTCVVHPFGGAGNLGKYVGVLDASPDVYEYVDRDLIKNYGTYTKSVSKGYQDLERLMNEPPHIGTMLEIDKRVTFTFIIINMIYYILFESILYASPGKRMLGGILLDSAYYRIGLGKAFIRGFSFGIFMLASAYILHFQMRLSYCTVFVVFFLLMDLPILFTKRSLLDLCTNTTYVKQK